MTTAAQYARDPEGHRAKARERYARYREDPAWLARQAARVKARRDSSPELRMAEVERGRAYRRDHPEKVAKSKRRSHHKQRYGITPEQFAEMGVRQGGLCLICLRKPDYTLVIDHDHATGKVRGLLCKPCNYILSLAADDSWRLRSAAAYLEGDEYFLGVPSPSAEFAHTRETVTA